MKKFILYFLLCMETFLSPQHAPAQNTETLYLSGAGRDAQDTRTWEFKCSAGMNSGHWHKIEVPSCWELQGFGSYTYGRFYLDKTARPSDESGLYRHTFQVPAHWKDKRVSIVFEGVMTDAEVSINGKHIGQRHQGGFYRFSYDVTDALRYGKKNLLEVLVHKESANTSVNAAERRADWWLFGGIYRPVYLEAVPVSHIEHAAVDARADGTLIADLHLQNIPTGGFIAASITPAGASQTISSIPQITALTGTEVQRITTHWPGISTWDCEHPRLYTLRLELLNAEKQVLHTREERIGFRTIEFRPKDGIYMNGVKLLVKGTNRHCFHPESGRTTHRGLSLEDALLIKEMNMNAVRSHYPPDTHFLEICDSLGLLYLNELAGWHDAYDDTTGMRLLEEMVKRDVNHPSIFIWSNGNEGGWNKQLDSRFTDFDPQHRHVVHPWSDFNGIDTHHYPAYQTGPYRLANGQNVFMPTEFLHGLYDRGLGAGLSDYWTQWISNPLFAGGFLWSYVDEAVRRTDLGNILDSDGPNGPDGIVGPYREKEGSFWTVREVWSPIRIEPLRITRSFSGRFKISNAYLYTTLKECRMTYRLLTITSPLLTPKRHILQDGEVTLPDLQPGETGTAHFTLPEAFFDADILELTAYSNDGKAVCTRTFPIKPTEEYFTGQRRQAAGDHQGKEISCPEAIVTDSSVCLRHNDLTVTFQSADGMITEIRRGNRLIPLSGGPLPVGMKARFLRGETRTGNHEARYVVYYQGAVDSIVWCMNSDGLLSMDAEILNRPNGGGMKEPFFDKKIDHLGFTFSYPEDDVKGVQWMGRGPYRVWKNRIQGTNYDLHQKDYNNTITGESFDNLIYPEFKGYHAGLYWATVQSNHTPAWTVYTETDGLYFRLFTPEEPKMRRNGENTMQRFPAGDLSFLLEIPAMRSMKTISELGPGSQPSAIRIKSGDDGFKIKLRFQL